MITSLSNTTRALRCFCRPRRNCASFRASQVGLQRFRDFLCDIAFDRKNIVQLPIVTLRPKMRVVLGIDQLDMHSHPVAGFADAAFQNIRNAELLAISAIGSAVFL